MSVHLFWYVHIDLYLICHMFYVSVADFQTIFPMLFVICLWSTSLCWHWHSGNLHGLPSLLVMYVTNITHVHHLLLVFLCHSLSVTVYCVIDPSRVIYMTYGGHPQLCVLCVTHIGLPLHIYYNSINICHVVLYMLNHVITYLYGSYLCHIIVFTIFVFIYVWSTLLINHIVVVMLCDPLLLPSTCLLVVWCWTLYRLNHVYMFACIPLVSWHIFPWPVGLSYIPSYICTHPDPLCVGCVILTCHILWPYDLAYHHYCVLLSCHICHMLSKCP
jgi:hypothetical protein